MQSVMQTISHHNGVSENLLRCDQFHEGLHGHFLQNPMHTGVVQTSSKLRAYTLLSLASSSDVSTGSSTGVEVVGALVVASCSSE